MTPSEEAGTSPPGSHRPARTLVRGLGVPGATSVVAGTIIGTGIFLSPSIVAREVGAPGLSLIVWVVCGILATCGALSFAELGAAIPRAGGTYAFLHRAFGRPWLPFLFGWSMLAVVLTGVMAAVATVFATYAGYFLEGVIPYGTWSRRGVAVACILFLTGMNVVGVRVGGGLQVVVTVVKVTALAGLVAVGLILGGLGPEGLEPVLPEDPAVGATLGAFGTAMIVALFAYNGWWYSTFVAEEVRSPARAIPLSILIGMGIVLVLYLLANVVYLQVLPFEVLQATERPASDAMELLLGPAGGGLIALAVLVSAFGTLNAQLLSIPRVYFAMARDGLFFRGISRVHPRFRTPAVAILVQGLWASVLAFSGTFQQIVTYTAFPNYLFLSLGVVGLMVLRAKEPDMARPFRVPGYPLTPLLFLCIFAWYLVNSLVHAFQDTLVGILLTLTGVPLYFIWRRSFVASGANHANGRDSR